MNEYFGLRKYKDVDKNYFDYIDTIVKDDISAKDLIYQFPVYVGEVNLARHLFFYDLYKKCIKLNGHIADVGTFKGASFMFMSKLVKLHELYNQTQVHGFDWFKGMKPSKGDDINQKDKYMGDYETLKRLISLQGLDSVAQLHKMDITKDMKNFIEEHDYIRFKMIFIDCGIKEVMESALDYLYPKLNYGGILIMDHFNDESSPSESTILEKYIGKNKIYQMPYNRQPTAYVIKEFD